jgi:hypothetical protein
VSAQEKQFFFFIITRGVASHAQLGPYPPLCSAWQFRNHEANRFLDWNFAPPPFGRVGLYQDLQV